MAGFDLRNEVRPSTNGDMAEWGTGNRNDFALACQVAGNRILEVTLIFMTDLVTRTMKRDKGK